MLENITFENVTVALLAIVAFGAGIWSWWFNRNTTEDVSDTTTKETNEE